MTNGGSGNDSGVSIGALSEVFLPLTSVLRLKAMTVSLVVGCEMTLPYISRLVSVATTTVVGTSAEELLVLKT